MPRTASLLSIVLLCGALAGCDALSPTFSRTGDTDQDQIDLPSLETPDVPDDPGPFHGKLIPKATFDRAKKSYLRYSPLIEFVIQPLEATYSPRVPRATLSYSPGQHPLPATQRRLFSQAVDRINATIGFKVFTMLVDGASSDIPVTDWTDFPSGSVLGETSAKVITRTGAATISVDIVETMHLRPGLTDAMFFKVALHELGHAAGLEHNPEPNSLMNKGTSARTPTDFAVSEKESLRLLYSLPDVPLPAPRETQSLPRPGIGWTLY